MRRAVAGGERQLLERAYAAFNARDIEGALATMDADVVWPNGMEGSTVLGHRGVRDVADEYRAGRLEQGRVRQGARGRVSGFSLGGNHQEEERP